MTAIYSASSLQRSVLALCEFETFMSADAHFLPSFSRLILGLAFLSCFPVTFFMLGRALVSDDSSHQQKPHTSTAAATATSNTITSTSKHCDQQTLHNYGDCHYYPQGYHLHFHRHCDQQNSLNHGPCHCDTHGYHLHFHRHSDQHKSHNHNAMKAGCVCHPLSQRGFVPLHSRGPGTYDCLSWPTKTRQHRGENVPAYHQ